MSDISRMSVLFDGLQSAHGVFFPERLEGKKQIGKSSTMRQPVTKDLWLSHLSGKVGLGIVPINEQSQCKWGAIDIDDYELDYVELLNSIKDTPLVCCKSKSEGAHLFIFCKEFVSAQIIKDYLRNIVGIIGLGHSEIFPKQDKVYSEHGDIGNWLNMPYFGNQRKCIKLFENEIIELNLDVFLDYAYSKQTDRSFFDDIKQIDYSQSPIDGGPPCLQVMSIKGFPSHTRNTSLFNVGIYCKKAIPDQWKVAIRNFNLKFFKDGKLSEREVEEIIKSLDKKEYAYQCYEEPLCSFCNAKMCRTRKYGISAIAGMPVVNSVTKISGDISIWFIDVEGGRLEMTTEELYDNRKFVMRCMNDLNILPHRMKPEKWTAFIQTLIDQSIEIRDETMFQRYEIPNLFKQFIISRLSKVPGDLESNRTIYDEDNKEIRFKFDSFVNYLKFKKMLPNKATLLMYFRSRGSRTGVAKDKLRRSIRYIALQLTDEEIISIEEKRKGDEIL